MFNVTLNLLFKLHRLAPCSPIPHRSSNRGSLQEVTLMEDAHMCKPTLAYSYTPTQTLAPGLGPKQDGAP